MYIYVYVYIMHNFRFPGMPRDHTVFERRPCYSQNW